MLRHRTIRSRMYFGIASLVVAVAILSLGSFEGVFKFRKVTKSIRERALELPLTSRLQREISSLRIAYYRFQYESANQRNLLSPDADLLNLKADFFQGIDAVRLALDDYQKQLESSEVYDPRFANIEEESKVVLAMRKDVEALRALPQGDNWLLISGTGVYGTAERLDDLQISASTLPELMKRRMEAFAEEAKTDYHTWITLSSISTGTASIILLLLVWKFNDWIFRPLNVLIAASRKVAKGDYSHRIELPTQDEVAELAAAMNDMTRHFCVIRDDLDQQVRERSREAIRNEQLASVGFLAAGVAHEINNPLASIAWAAESMESRLSDLGLEESFEAGSAEAQELEVIRKYLRRIESEAFRCKEITDGLLDFSRTGNSTKSRTDLNELCEGVIEMVRHLGKYKQKKIAFVAKERVFATVCPQEIKQVVLNLVTNALDSVSENGQVQVELSTKNNLANLRVVDNGCGMTPEVLEHLFEPFFTTKQNGQGTGLGLSITYRIVKEHGGAIVPFSNGASRGSEFTVTLPLDDHAKKINEKQRKAA